MWPLSQLLRPDAELDLEIGAFATAFATGRTPAPGDVSKMNVSVAGNGVDEAHWHARFVVGYGVALREPSLVTNQPTASAGRIDQPTGV